MSNVITIDKTADSGSSRLKRTIVCLCALLFCPAFSAVAQNVTLAWDRSSETNLTNYTLKYGVSSGNYTGQVAVAANTTTATVSNLPPGRTYYFVVTARNTFGME